MQKLCEKFVIPIEVHGWYKSLPHGNVPDFIPDVADGDSDSEADASDDDRDNNVNQEEDPG